MSTAIITRAAIESAPLPVVLIAWKPRVKGSLRVFADVQLGRSLRIRECPVLVRNGRAWAALLANATSSGTDVLDEECVA
jgi:hypothetical protein